MIRACMVMVAVLATTGTAFAQTATVSVRVVDSAGRPIDGTVTFRGNGTASCRTVGGRCQLRVAPGTWTATLQPVRERAPAARRVTVRAGTTAAVTFRTLAATPATTTTIQGVNRTAVTTRRTVPTTTTRMATTTRRTATTTRTTSQAGTVTTTRGTTTRRGTVTRRGTTTQGASTNQVTATRRTTTTAPVGPSTTSTQMVVTPRTTARIVSTGVAPSRNLSQGQRLCAQGTIIDAQGRPTDASVTVRQGNATVGTVRSVAGRFSMFDLAPGTYELTTTFVRSNRVQRRTVTITASVARITLRDR